MLGSTQKSKMVEISYFVKEARNKKISLGDIIIISSCYKKLTVEFGPHWRETGVIESCLQVKNMSENDL